MGRYIALLTTMILFACSGCFAQKGSGDGDFWVDHWSRPLLSFGPEEEAFNRNMQVIFFPWNDHDEPSNPKALEDNVQWLKDRPNVHFYVDGYASSRGELLYNLNLSQRRANWVKQTLVSQGIRESRIKVAAGWGQLYPVCPELNDDCWSKNRLVRFVYAPD